MRIGANRIDRRCGPDRALGDGFGRKTAADAAKIVLTEQVASPVLAERKHQSPPIVRRTDGQRYRMCPAEIGILSIQCKPVRRRKEVVFLARSMQVWSKSDPRLIARASACGRPTMPALWRP